ncbi:hypothetical protein AB6A40_000444 [Gnathostoma spinigerum]|uniref:Uncharacterized protein n=1 Tax=Gnathostoma spinigerum TaxID=75299 RepID=A0ABD6E320_9BILA
MIVVLYLFASYYIVGSFAIQCNVGREVEGFAGNVMELIVCTPNVVTCFKQTILRPYTSSVIQRGCDEQNLCQVLQEVSHINETDSKAASEFKEMEDVFAYKPSTSFNIIDYQKVDSECYVNLQEGTELCCCDTPGCNGIAFTQPTLFFAVVPLFLSCLY